MSLTGLHIVYKASFERSPHHLTFQNYGYRTTGSLKTGLCDADIGEAAS